MVSQEIAVFANRVRVDLDGVCYLALFHNDEGYDIEVEANQGVIAGTFATYSHDLENAREVADAIAWELEDWGIKVFSTRKKWEKHLFQN